MRVLSGVVSISVRSCPTRGADGSVVWAGVVAPWKAHLVTANAHLKQLVRARMAATGESYAVARDHVQDGLAHIHLSDPLVADVHGRHGQAVVFTPDGHRVLSGGQDARVAVLDADDGTPTGELVGHGKVVNAVVVLGDGRTVATASSDRTLRTWDLESGEATAVLEGHRDAVTALVAMPDGRRVVSGGYDGRLGLWEPTDPLPAALHVTGLRRVAAVAPVDDRVVAASGLGPLVELRDVGTGELLGQLDTGAPGVTGLAVAPDGALLAAAGYDGTVTLWDTATRTEVRRVTTGAPRVSAVAFSRSGRLLGVAADRRVLLVTPAGDLPAAEIELPIAGVYALAFSRDERRLAQTGADGRVRIWTLR